MGKKNKTAVPAVDEPKLDKSEYFRRFVTGGIDVEAELQRIIAQGGSRATVATAALYKYRKLAELIDQRRGGPPGQRRDLVYGAALAFELGTHLEMLKVWPTVGRERRRSTRQREQRKTQAAARAARARELFAAIPERDRKGRRGCIYRDIAKKLGVKERTVRNYLAGQVGNG